MKLEDQVTWWHRAGRILPLVALVILGLVLVADLDGWISYTVAGIAIMFATAAFSWWFWVIGAIKKIYQMLDRAQQGFDNILKELKSIKSDLKDKDDTNNR